LAIEAFVSENDAADGEFETANSELNKGLKTCRSVVSNYRALLSSTDIPMIQFRRDGSGERSSEIHGDE